MLLATFFNLSIFTFISTAGYRSHKSRQPHPPLQNPPHRHPPRQKARQEKIRRPAPKWQIHRTRVPKENGRNVPPQRHHPTRPRVHP